MNKALSWILKQWYEWRGVLLFLGVLIPVKSSLADWNWVPTGSMNPTIVEGDLVFINKLAYDLRVPLTLNRVQEWSNPEKGDISVLLSPDDRTRLVKRVIGTPGDRVAMRENVLYINGDALEYSHLSRDDVAELAGGLRELSIFAMETLNGRDHAVMSTPGLLAQHRNFAEFTVPAGKYFVMGDNRDNSRDSRSIGLVDRELFLGKAERVLVSFNIKDKYQPRFERFFTNLP